MEKLTDIKLLRLGFNIVGKDICDSPIYRRSGTTLNNYPFDIDVILSDYPETNPNIGIVILHMDECKDCPAPTNEDLNHTIDLEEMNQPVAWGVYTVERLKLIIESLTNIKI